MQITSVGPIFQVILFLGQLLQLPLDGLSRVLQGVDDVLRMAQPHLCLDHPFSQFGHVLPNEGYIYLYLLNVGSQCGLTCRTRFVSALAASEAAAPSSPSGSRSCRGNFSSWEAE